VSSRRDLVRGGTLSFTFIDGKVVPFLLLANAREKGKRGRPGSSSLPAKQEGDVHNHARSGHKKKGTERRRESPKGRREGSV